jgi:hypothetical protein
MVTVDASVPSDRRWKGHSRTRLCRVYVRPPLQTVRRHASALSVLAFCHRLSHPTDVFVRALICLPSQEYASTKCAGD